MPEIAARGDNWFISHHQEGYVEVLEVALPSNRRIRLEFYGGDTKLLPEPIRRAGTKLPPGWEALCRLDVVLKILNRFEDKAEKWEAVADFKRVDLDGIASLFVKASDRTLDDEGDKRGWRPFRWLWHMVFGRRDERGTIDDMFERVGFADEAGRTGGKQDRQDVSADGGGGGRDRQDGGAPSADGPGAA